MKKIKAYTLMEVTVAMLISAICITVCYTAYGIISGYYLRLQQKQAVTGDANALVQVLEKDFLNSSLVLRTAEGLEVMQPSGSIYYKFNEKEITRAISTMHTDTFKLVSKDLHYGFEREEVIVPDTVDRISFSVILEGKINIPVQVIKYYSASELFK